jgi:hypothetical protein
MQNITYESNLKGTVSRDFLLLVFFMNQFPPSPGEIRKLRCTTSMNDTGGKFAPGVNDTGGKFCHQFG